VARLHAATLTPTKPELLAAWVPQQPWCPDDATDVEVVGAFRFDDPEGEVGIETFLVRTADTILQVPLTYRAAPRDGADDALVTQLEHSVLGTRWVYDGVHDPRYLMMVAAVAMTGQGQAVGMVELDGRWYVGASPIRLSSGVVGATHLPVDGFRLESDDADGARLRSDHHDLVVHRRPAPGAPTDVGLTATWDDHEPVVLAEIHTR
jgi:hypothetical protein